MKEDNQLQKLEAYESFFFLFESNPVLKIESFHQNFEILLKMKMMKMRREKDESEEQERR